MNDLVNTLRQRKFKILLIGDNCIDKYVFGSVERISPEAPVPVLKIDETKNMSKPGMAGNVHQNLLALGNEVDFLFSATSTKTRVVDIRSGYHLIRIDEDVKSNPFEPVSEFPNAYDAIVISDYNKGTITYSNVRELRRMFNGPIFIDTKKDDLQRFDGCFVKINESEFNRSVSETEHMIITLGHKGTLYNKKIYPTDQVEVHDVTGAGDVFLASLVTFYLNTKSIEDAIPYANKLATISVQHKGTYKITNEDLKSL